jgi:hypothetical protein
MTYQLSRQARETVMLAARTMFPHEKLPDEAYAKVIDKLEVEAAGSDTAASTIEHRIAQLDDPEPFAALEADARQDPGGLVTESSTAAALVAGSP